MNKYLFRRGRGTEDENVFVQKYFYNNIELDPLYKYDLTLEWDILSTNDSVIAIFYLSCSRELSQIKVIKRT